MAGGPFLQMSYVTQQQLETEIPAPHLADAVDDDAAGGADADKLDAILQKASDAVDAFLSSIYPTPFADPAPAACREAAFCFAGEMVYARRGVSSDSNPFSKRANDWRETLKQMGAGKLPLDANITKAFTPGAAILETAVIDTSTR